MNGLFPVRRASLTLLFALSFALPLQAADDVQALLATIKAVGREGAGNPAAAKAWQALTHLGPDALPAILAGFDDDNPVGTNWLRAATDDIGERSLREKKPLPAAALEKFLLDMKNSAAGRQAAYKWFARADPKAPARLLPGFLHDRSPELRRDAPGNARNCKWMFVPAVGSAFILHRRKELNGASSCAQKVGSEGTSTFRIIVAWPSMLIEAATKHWRSSWPKRSLCF